MTILDALKAVSARDDDHATVWNHVGFSGQDTVFANKLAALDSLSPKQEVYAAKMVRKYRNQVFAYLCLEAKDYPKTGKTHDQAVANFLCGLTWQHPTFDFTRELPVEKPKMQGKISAIVADKTGTLKGFVIRFPYNPAMVFAVKLLPNRKFVNDANDKRWVTGGASTDVTAVAAFARQYNMEMSEATRSFLGLI